MLRFLQAGFRSTRRYPEIILLVYLLHLIPGVVIAGRFYQKSVAEANGSLALNKLLPDFDYMVFSDFMRYHGKAFLPEVLIGLGVAGVFFLLSNLLIGGVFYHYKAQPQRFSFNKFIQEGWRMFGKYLLILLVEIFLLLIVFMLSGIFYFIFALVAEGGNERTYILWLLVPTVLLIFMSSVVIVISDYTRYFAFEFKQLGVWQGVGKAASYVLGNFRTVGLYWIVLGIGICLLLIYLGVDALVGMSNLPTVIFMFVIQQLLVVGRVLLKHFNYGIIQHVYEQHPITFAFPIAELNFQDDLESSVGGTSNEPPTDE